MEYLYVTLIALGGSFIQASSGFGYAAFCMALWPLVIPFRQAVALEVITALFMVAYLTFKLRKHINFRLMLYPLLSTVVFSTLGVFTLMTGAETFLRRILGGALILLSVYFIFINGRIRVKPNRFNGLLAGGLSGLLGGLFAIGGPPIVIYLMSVTDDKMEYNATLQCYFFISSLYILFLHLVMGNVTGATVGYGGVALLGVLVGTAAGLYLFQKLPMQTIRKMVSGFMAAAGLYLAING